ncbi:hypothetical protein GCM10009566_30370 [Streptomyces murinus]
MPYVAARACPAAVARRTGSPPRKPFPVEEAAAADDEVRQAVPCPKSGSEAGSDTEREAEADDHHAA